MNNCVTFWSNPSGTDIVFCKRRRQNKTNHLRHLWQTFVLSQLEKQLPFLSWNGNGWNLESLMFAIRTYLEKCGSVSILLINSFHRSQKQPQVNFNTYSSKTDEVLFLFFPLFHQLFTMWDLKKCIKIPWSRQNLGKIWLAHKIHLATLPPSWQPAFMAYFHRNGIIQVFEGGCSSVYATNRLASSVGVSLGSWCLEVYTSEE